MYKGRILVTGASGAGKSTLAGILARSHNLPVIHMDELPEWKEFRSTQPAGPLTSVWQKEYEHFAKKFSQDVIAQNTYPCIIEGQYLLELSKKDFPADCTILVTDPGKDQVIQQRVNRSLEKLPEAARTTEVIAEKTKHASELYDICKPKMDRLKNANEREIVQIEKPKIKIRCEIGSW